jgi:phosphate transport system substrate-binding protein
MRLTALTAAAALALALSGCPGGTSSSHATHPRVLTIKGSDTMVHLVAAWAEAYGQAHPEAEVTVTGGGTGTGIAALINGTTDVAMASRDMKPEEQALAEEGGRPLERVVVGLDGLAIVVHRDNPVEELTTDQLRQVFNGTLTRWSQVGGPDRPIQVLSRESSSGTYGFFKEHVLKGDDFGPGARLLPSTSAIVQAARQDAWSIGYVGLGYLQDAGLDVVKVKADAGALAVAPSIETVTDKSYPIARTLLLYAPAERTGLTKAFIDFVLSPEGQRLVAESGYVPLSSS